MPVNCTCTFGEGDGTVEVCAVFLEPIDPTQIAPNVVVELMGYTSPGTANGKWSQIYQQIFNLLSLIIT